MRNVNPDCPICGEGTLHEQVVWEQTEYKGKHLKTPLYFAECDTCGSEQAGAAHARRNKRALTGLKKRADGLLAGEELRRLRERLGLTQAQAAQVFGGGPVAFSKYESDDVAQSEAMDKLLRLADALPEAFARLTAEAGILPAAEGHRRARWVTIGCATVCASSNADVYRPRLRLVQTHLGNEPGKKYG